MKVNQLFAGAGKAEVIFSNELFPLEGFRGVHDHPMARVLLLDCGERVAIACLELVMLSDDGVDAVKKIIGEQTHTKMENIWVHVTHVITTPHAPHAPRGMGGVALEISEEEKKTLDRKITLFNETVECAVLQASIQAMSTFQSVKMGVSSGLCMVNVNRDVETPHGWWINFNPEGPSNHTATILRFDGQDGKPVAAFISYGLKPCAIDNSEMDANNRLISSDVPGLACRLLEKELGAVCLFAMSAAGDQVPLEQAWYDVVEADGTVRKVDNGVQVGLEIVDRLGRRMAKELAPVLEGVDCSLNAPLIRLDQAWIEWTGKDRNPMKPTLSVQYEPKGTQRVDVLAMTIGEVVLVGLKPEINAVTEKQLQEESPFAHTLVLSMVNGGQKYMPDLGSYEKGTWEALSAPLMPGAAEAWVEKAANMLKGMHSDS